MNWDYRIVKNQDNLYKLHQIFYKEDGSIYGMADEELSIEGLEIEELEIEFEAISKAFLKPIIDLSKRKKKEAIVLESKDINIPDKLRLSIEE